VTTEVAKRTLYLKKLELIQLIRGYYRVTTQFRCTLWCPESGQSLQTSENLMGADELFHFGQLVGLSRDKVRALLKRVQSHTIATADVEFPGNNLLLLNLKPTARY